MNAVIYTAWGRKVAFIEPPLPDWGWYNERSDLYRLGRKVAFIEPPLPDWGWYNERSDLYRLRAQGSVH